VPLLLLDLENTLIDRTGAFRGWAEKFLSGLGAPDTDLDWLLDTDGDGLANREDVATAIRDRYLLTTPIDEIVDEIRHGLVAHVRLDPLVACTLQIAGNAGWVPVVVTNGVTRMQQAVIIKSGLDRYIADWVVSESAGVRKPDPRIFEVAADRVRMSLGGAWMVGDSPGTDIGCAAAAGLPSVWLHRGRTWPERRYAPTYEAESCIAAVAAVLDDTGPVAQLPRNAYRRH